MAPEQAVALTDENSPYFIAGGFELFVSALQSQGKIERAFRSGDGLSWGAHDPGLFDGTLRFFKSGYIGYLVAAWLPALDGVVPKLEAGARVADVGCGLGASTIIMAQAFPRSRFWGFDNHEPSIQAARKAAQEAGVADRVTFEVAPASGFPANDYDLVTFFDCLHDLGDPEGAMKHANEALAPDGTVMIVEPMAGETVTDNLNPVGRVYSAASVLICTPHALSESHSRALGTLASEAALRGVAQTGGFSLFRRVTETPFNRVFEALK
jgi:2-polyprenyl-3-methyl-5-hydroxy-6-metoxy-1,4-benzoquinol methylase